MAMIQNELQYAVGGPSPLDPRTLELGAEFKPNSPAGKSVHFVPQVRSILFSYTTRGHNVIQFTTAEFQQARFSDNAMSAAFATGV